jgi:hypothetical protein
VADPGVVDVSAAWTAALPAELVGLLRRGDRAGFDRELRLALLFSPDQAAALRDRATPYGGAGGSLAELYETVGSYRLGPEAANITTPLLVTDPVGERRWPGQSRLLFDRLGGPKALAPHASAAVRETAIFDWLGARLASA